MKLEEIKQGYEFYTISLSRLSIIKWKYHSIYPLSSNKKGLLYDYHIVINKSLERPERVFGLQLQKDLDENLRTYQDAKAKLKEHLEKKLKEFEENY